MAQKIEIYDTTLRDGSQGEGVSFSLDDKIQTALQLDELGVDYIEGGWPLSNPKDAAFFQEIRKHDLKHARVAAFGSTRRANKKAEDDQNLQTLVSAESPVVTIFGKSWDLHVTDALKVSFDENLAMISDSVAFLKKSDRFVVYDAEHFFDGFKNNQDYAIKTIVAAQESGADIISLCDTNGGTLPQEIKQIIETVKQHISIKIGIHAHNDGGLGVANALAAVEVGAVHVQGTMNGFGERCGNSDLTSVVPNLEIKMGYDCLPDGHLKKLTEVSRFVYDITNNAHVNNQPFTGVSAFAHKGGIHVSAVNKNAMTYEHIAPETVGNTRRILISELSGRSNVLAKSDKYDMSEHPEVLKTVLQQVQDLENDGYSFEAAEASFELLMRRAMGEEVNFFDNPGYRVIIEKRSNDSEVSEATVKIKTGDTLEHAVAEGDGPLDALKLALRNALEPHYPCVADMRLTDYQMRILEGNIGTEAKVRVIITSQDKKDVWSTVGVSNNSLDASWQALIESVRYKIVKDQDQ